MPAQENQIFQNPINSKLIPWYSLPFGNLLKTPEWTFHKNHLRRFKNKWGFWEKEISEFTRTGHCPRSRSGFLPSRSWHIRKPEKAPPRRFPQTCPDAWAEWCPGCLLSALSELFPYVWLIRDLGEVSIWRGVRIFSSFWRAEAESPDGGTLISRQSSGKKKGSRAKESLWRK